MKLAPSSPPQPDSDIHGSVMFDWMDKQQIRQIFYSTSHTLQCDRKKKLVAFSKLGDRVFCYLPRILKIPIIDVLPFFTTLDLNSGRTGENTG